MIASEMAAICVLDLLVDLVLVIVERSDPDAFVLERADEHRLRCVAVQCPLDAWKTELSMRLIMLVSSSSVNCGALSVQSTSTPRPTASARLLLDRREGAAADRAADRQDHVGALLEHGDGDVLRIVGAVEVAGEGARTPGSVGTRPPSTRTSSPFCSFQ